MGISHFNADFSYYFFYENHIQYYILDWLIELIGNFDNLKSCMIVYDLVNQLYLAVTTNCKCPSHHVSNSERVTSILTDLCCNSS